MSVKPWLAGSATGSAGADGVLARAALAVVGAAPAVEAVRARAAEELVGAAAALDRVVAVAGADQVAAALPEDLVVPGAAEDHVGPGGSAHNAARLRDCLSNKLAGTGGAGLLDRAATG